MLCTLHWLEFSASQTTFYSSNLSARLTYQKFSRRQQDVEMQIRIYEILCVEQFVSIDERLS
jgi:hypothetical protein